MVGTPSPPSGGTLKKPQADPTHTTPTRPRPPGNDIQMGESASEEEALDAFPLTDVDRWVLSQTDDEFKPHTWDELRELIRMKSTITLTHT